MPYKGDLISSRSFDDVKGKLQQPMVTADMVKAYIDNLDLSALAEVLSYGAEAYKRAIIQELARQKAAALPCFLHRELQSALKDLIEVCEGKNYWHDSTGRAYQYKMRADNTREFVNAIKTRMADNNSDTDDKVEYNIKRNIYNAVFMSKGGKDGGEQFAWDSFNNYFNRNAK